MGARGRGARARAAAPAAVPAERGRVGLAGNVAAAAAVLFGAATGPAAALDGGVLKEKGHAFAESSAQVLRTVGAKELRGAIQSAVDVAVSVDPNKALKAVDAGLQAVQSAPPQELVKAVNAAEAATAEAVKSGNVIPSDATIDGVVDAVADVAAKMDAGKVKAFAGAATDAAKTIDGKSMMGLTMAGAKVGLSSDKSALASATAAAGDLLLALSK